MNLEQKVDGIEAEMMLMKGEIKQTLVDLREFIMKQGSPFMIAAEGGAGSKAGIPPDIMEQLVEQARSIAQEEASSNIQRGIEELYRENQRQMESMQALQGDPGATAALQQEIEELRRQSQEQMEALRATQGSQSDPEATASLRREIEDLRREGRRREEVVRVQQAPSIEVGRGPAGPGPQVVQAPGPAQGQPQVIHVQQAPPRQAEQSRGISQSDVERMLEEAKASAREEAMAGMRREMEEVRRQAQAQQAQARPLQVEAPEPEFEEPERGRAPVAKKPQPQVIRVQQAPSRPAPEEWTEEIPVELAPGFEAPYVAEEAAESIGALTGEPAGRESLDANLLTSLLRWVGSVKRRLGKNHLAGFLEMYKLTGHLPPSVEKLVLMIAALDALPDESSDQIFTLDDVMDSLLQLHAIIYGPGHAVRGALMGLEDEPALEDMEADG